MTQRLIVRPFVGLRYRRADLSGILAPPYDIITPEQQERLHRRDPHNVVRLELGYGGGGGDQDDRYARSAKTLQLWRQEGVLAYDDGPCLYPHSHTFATPRSGPSLGAYSAEAAASAAKAGSTSDLGGPSTPSAGSPRLPLDCARGKRSGQAGSGAPRAGEKGLSQPFDRLGVVPTCPERSRRSGVEGRSESRGAESRTRLGVLCAVRLTPFDAGMVLPHEGTLAAPREDRRRLMLACQAQVSPVFALHDDPDGEIAAVISEMMAQDPVAEAETSGEYHCLWRRRQDELTDRYCELLGQGPLFIADGHHRYETALTVSRELAQTHPQAPPEAAFNHVLALLCPAAQPGVVILPTHRLLRLPNVGQRAHLEALVERHFQRRNVECAGADARDAARALVQSLEHSDGGDLFGMYTARNGCSLLEVKPEYMPRNPGAGGIDELGTVLIHRLLMDPVLGPDGLSACVEYVTSEAEAVQRVDEGRADCALFLRPTTVEQVKRVAGAGLRMPGKSTYFYPKAPTGLVINDISPERIIS